MKVTVESLRRTAEQGSRRSRVLADSAGTVQVRAAVSDDGGLLRLNYQTEGGTTELVIDTSRPGIAGLIGVNHEQETRGA